MPGQIPTLKKLFDNMDSKVWAAIQRYQSAIRKKNKNATAEVQFDATYDALVRLSDKIKNISALCTEENKNRLNFAAIAVDVYHEYNEICAQDKNHFLKSKLLEEEVLKLYKLDINTAGQAVNLSSREMYFRNPSTFNSVTSISSNDRNSFLNYWSANKGFSDGIRGKPYNGNYYFLDSHYGSGDVEGRSADLMVRGIHHLLDHARADASSLIHNVHPTHVINHMGNALPHLQSVANNVIQSSAKMGHGMINTASQLINNAPNAFRSLGGDVTNVAQNVGRVANNIISNAPSTLSGLGGDISGAASKIGNVASSVTHSAGHAALNVGASAVHQFSGGGGGGSGISADGVKAIGSLVGGGGVVGAGAASTGMSAAGGTATGGVVSSTAASTASTTAASTSAATTSASTASTATVHAAAMKTAVLTTNYTATTSSFAATSSTTSTTSNAAAPVAKGAAAKGAASTTALGAAGAALGAVVATIATVLNVNVAQKAVQNLRKGRKQKRSKGRLQGMTAGLVVGCIIGGVVGGPLGAFILGSICAYAGHKVQKEWARHQDKRKTGHTYSEKHLLNAEQKTVLTDTEKGYGCSLESVNRLHATIDARWETAKRATIEKLSEKPKGEGFLEGMKRRAAYYIGYKFLGRYQKSAEQKLYKGMMENLQSGRITEVLAKIGHDDMGFFPWAIENKTADSSFTRGKIFVEKMSDNIFNYTVKDAQGLVHTGQLNINQVGVKGPLSKNSYNFTKQLSGVKGQILGLISEQGVDLSFKSELVRQLGNDQIERLESEAKLETMLEKCCKQEITNTLAASRKTSFLGAIFGKTYDHDKSNTEIKFDALFKLIDENKGKPWTADMLGKATELLNKFPTVAAESGVHLQTLRRSIVETPSTNVILTSKNEVMDSQVSISQPNIIQSNKNQPPPLPRRPGGIR